MAKQCIDCGRMLFPAVRSIHQPNIRCLDCFDSFRESVSAKLKSWCAFEEDTLEQAENRARNVP